MVQALGREADSAASGEAALALFEPGAFDTLITGFNLPCISGAELAPRLKQSNTGLEVVFLTGYGSLPGQAPAFAHTVLQKPCDLERLAALLAVR